MIWHAIIVTRQKEFLFERILREKQIAQPFVPIKYSRRKNPRNRKIVLVAYPQYPGLVFIPVDIGEPVAWESLQSFDLFRGIIADARGRPRYFTEPEMIRICGQSQRPYLLKLEGKKRRKFLPNAEISSGPHQGRIVKAFFPPRSSQRPFREVDQMFALD